MRYDGVTCLECKTFTVELFLSLEDSERSVVVSVYRKGDLEVETRRTGGCHGRDRDRTLHTEEASSRWTSSKDFDFTSSALHGSRRHAKAELVPAHYHNIVVRNTPTSSLKALLLPSDLCSRMLVILSTETGIAGGKLGDSTKAADRDSVTQLIETS